MNGWKRGWRSLAARFRGRGPEERSAEPPETGKVSGAESPRDTDEEGTKDAAPPEGAGETAAETEDDAESAAKAGDEAETENEAAAEAPSAEEEVEDEETEPSREERLEQEIRDLREEVKRLETDLTEQRAARSRIEEEVRALGEHDPLTGVTSARRFADRLSVAIVHAQRYKGRLAVVQLGLDRFQKINERLGRGLGDDLLKSVALALENSLRQGDTIARFGSDVFTILLPGLKRDEDMTVIADKLRLALRSPFSIGGHDLLITASLGVALFPDDGPDVESLLESASVALKRAKERGGDSWDVHSPRSRALAAERQAKEGALRKALVQNDLKLYWQPVVECETGAIVGVEALLRWADPRGVVPAADFISLAEVSGLAVPLGHWTLRAACQQGRKWHEAGHEGLVISVNVSEKQLQHPAVVKLVRRVLDETSLPPSCLELEVSEAELMRNPERAIERLTQLRELGLRVALDDFGSGESRLGLLFRYPIDTLKIGGSVVKEAASSHDHEAVIRAAVALAHSRKLRVVAEAVETEAQRVLLVRWQCHRMQGHLSGPPATASETEQLLLRQRKAARALSEDDSDEVRRLL
ncbi:MAG: EAL domain-containing protein [Acidobacteria bacterium]|jgi:diguanylate cyclase (GGDEF)-like protein|nr:EAL domain-containing protein [Acidobacteriota bacterium]